jgi:hypothetical protein
MNFMSSLAYLGMGNQRSAQSLLQFEVPTSLAAEPRLALAQALELLAAGERLASKIAALQARQSIQVDEARFFKSQQSQEQFHAIVFEVSARLLRLGAPMTTSDTRASSVADADTDMTAVKPAMSADVFQAFAHAVLAPTLAPLHRVIATQIVLEGVGENILRCLDAGLGRHRAGLVGLRRRILAQEATHHAFGEQLIGAALATGALRANDLGAVREEFSQLVLATVRQAEDALRVFRLSPESIVYGHEHSHA